MLPLTHGKLGVCLEECNRMSIYDQGLRPGPHNNVPLTPLSLLTRAGRVYPDQVSVRYGDQVCTWGDTLERCLRLASGLRALGIGKNDTVAVLAPNTQAAVEVAFAVPGSGAVLNMINTRLDAQAIAFILDHGEAKAFLVDAGLADVAAAALALAQTQPLVIDIADSVDAAGADAAPLGNHCYEALIESNDAEPFTMPESEWDAIALNYTSGTTGNPKGVVYHHRGAYLNGLGNALEWALPHHPIYLWTLPLFHCNGWCFPWTLAAVAGENICLRAPEPAPALDLIESAGITHLSGAPIVLNMLTTEAEQRGLKFKRAIRMTTAGAAPPAAVLARAAEVGFDVTHVYGLTEVYGPATICAWKEDYNNESAAEQARLKARQGVNYTVLEELSVRNPDTMELVPKDGATMGEIMFRGNIVMKGYLKNPEASAAAFAGGHFRSGDLAVWHPDSYVEIKDRSKDIIISGGENISSIEVEGALYQHPAVGTAAVVAAPHEKWGETPYAFVELAAGGSVTAAELIAHCREQLAHFKCPSQIVFGELPKTSTGKIQKFELRARAQALAAQ